MIELHRLARAVAAPLGAPAVFCDERDAGPERSVASEADAREILRACERGESGFAALATGETGIEVYRNAAVAARVLGRRVPVRVRWNERFDIKAATLALLYGADELVGALAERDLPRRMPLVGGAPEDPARPTRRHVEALIRAAGRTPRSAP